MAETCKRGHARTPDNLTANGTCRECNRMHAKASADRKREREGRTRRPPVDTEMFPCGHPRSDENRRPGRHDCATCHRESENRRYWTDPEAHRRSASAYQKTNREAATARQKAWRQRNIEASRSYARANERRRRVSAEDVDTKYWADLVRMDPCSYCGAAGPNHVDHIVPVAQGGGNHWTNFASACATCNRAKSANSLLHYLLADRGEACIPVSRSYGR